MANGQKQNGGGFGLGDFLKTLGVVGASALIPGFGTGYADARSKRLELEAAQGAARQKAAMKIAQMAAEEGNEAGVQAVAPSLDSQLAEAFTGMARQRAAMRSQASQIGGGGQDFIPASVGAAGETTALTTPTGRSVISGEGGIRPPLAPASSEGEFQTSFNISQKGDVGRTVSPVGASTKRFRNEEKARQRILTLQDDFTQRGFSPQDAQIAAVQSVSREGLPIPQELQPFLQVGAPGAPAGETPPPGVEGEVPIGNEEPSRFVSPPGGQAPAAPAPAGEGIAARKTREAAKARLEVRLDSPLSRSDIAHLTDPKTGKPLAFGTTARQAARMGAVPLRPGTGAIALANKGANAVLDQYEKLNTKLFKGVRGLSANVNGPKLFVEALANPDSDARQIWELQATLPQIIRALGEKGTLAQQDVQRGLQAVPGFNETEKSAARKIETLRTILAAASGSAAPTGAPTPEPQAPTGAGDLGDGFTFEVVQ